MGSVLQSLRSVFSSEPVRIPAPAATPAQQKQGLSLLEEIMCGTHYAVLNTAVVGSGFNALRSKRKFQRPGLMRNNIPHPPSARLSWGRLMHEMQQPEAVSVPVASFLTHLAVIEKQVEFICAEIEANGQSAVILQHSARIGQAAKQMADMGIAALNALEKIASATLTSYFMRNMVLLRGLLIDVAAGGSPLVDRDGRILVPDLPQRRPPFRKHVQLPCIIECKGKEHRALVSNISAGGVGIERTPPLSPRSVVVIEIKERCFTGRVVWVSASSAGIKFDTPLREEDPLLVV